MRPAVKKSLSVAAAFFAVWLAARFLLPLCFPFLLGALLAFAAEPMVGFLQKRRVPRCVCSGIGVSMAFCFLAMLVLILCAFALRELRRVAGVLPDLEDTAKSGIGLLQSWLLELASRAPQSVQPLLSENVTSFFSNGTSLLDKVIRYILGLAGSILSHIPDGALSLGTAVISSFLISARLPKIKSWLKKRLPGEKLKPAADALKRMKNAVGGWLMAQLKLMGVTFTILTLGFVMLRIAYAPLWALVVALVVVLFIRTFLFTIIRVDGHSMDYTLADGERMFVTILDKKLFGVGRDDVVICHFPGRGHTYFVKRVRGVPGDVVTAIMLGALMIQGMTPGPLLFQEQGTLVYSIFIALFVSNVFMLLLGYYAVRLFAKVVLIPGGILMPLVTTLCVVGGYALNNSNFDLAVMAGFGLLGYIMTKARFPLAPLLLAMILSGIIETNFRRALSISNQDFSVFFTRPVCASFLAISLFILFNLLWKEWKKYRAASAA
mgnify:CR=1 FL=1